MTQLTYTIAHIKVGAENYWEEVEGFVSGDKESLLFDKKKIDDIIIRYAENNNHPLFDLANLLGATIYGGFQDENDFYLVMPTIEGLKVGDVKKEFTLLNDEANRIIVLDGIDFCYGYKVDSKYTISSIASNVEYIIKNNILYGDDNLFKEYAKTGILNNDIYKQFFE